MGRIIAAILSLSLLWPSLCWAGSVSPTDGFLFAAPTTTDKDFHLETDVSYVGRSDFSGDIGSVAIVRTGIKVDYSIFELAYGYSHFAWDGKEEVALAMGTGGDKREPWEVLHDFTLQTRLINDTFHKQWRYWLDLALTSSFEAGETPGAMGIGFDGGLAYDVWPGWSIGMGAKTIAVNAISSDLIGDVELGLVLGASHEAVVDALESLGIYTDDKDAEHRFGFSIAMSGAQKTYKSKGYIGLVRSKLGAYFEYSPTPDCTFSLGPEYHYHRKYKFYTKTGELESSHTLGDSWGGYARALWKF